MHRVSSSATRFRLTAILVLGFFALTGCSNGALWNPFDSTAPGEVAEVTATPAATSITLAWADPRDRDFRQVEISWDDGSDEESVTVEAGAQEHRVEDLASGREYRFTLRSVDRSGNRSTGVTEKLFTSIPYTLDVTWESAVAGGALSASDAEARAVTASRGTVDGQSDPGGAGFSAVRELNRVKDELADSIVIKYREDIVLSQALKGAIAQYGRERLLRAVGGFRLSRLVVDEAAGRSVDAVIQALEALPQVEFAERDARVYALGEVDDPLFDSQWNFAQLRLPAVWDQVTGDPSVVVAVVDSGVARNLSDFSTTSFVAGRDLVNDDADADDDNAHGTHVAGTIAQSTDNGVGVAGMAPDVGMMPVKVLGQDGSGTISDVAAGITWAVDNGADVINLSLGGAGPTQTGEAAVRYAYENGVAVIAASGNSDGAVGYPAAYDDYVLAVGATRYDKQRAAYSNYGPELDVVAPGGDTSVDQNGDGAGDGILQQTIAGYIGDSNDPDFGTTDYTPGYYLYQGTSMAAPHVAALAALLLTKDPRLSPAELYATITASAEDLGAAGRDDEYGYGLIDPLAALSDEMWFISDARNDSLNPGDGQPDEWELPVSGGTVAVSLSFDHQAGNLDLRLYDPAGNLVASSASTNDNESMSYATGGVSGTYLLEVSLGE